MALNRKFSPESNQYLAVPSGTASGDPLVIGNIPCIALTDRDAAGFATVAFAGYYELPVVGADGSGNSAVAIGDIVYYDTDEVNVDGANGVRFGYALGAVVSGATTAILVRVGY